MNEPILPLRDILESISRIESFLEGYTFDRFIHDDKTIAAVERKLQIITEAAFRLGEHAELLCPGIPWRNIRGTGNRLRHQYDRVDLETVWITATIDLSTLKASVSNAIASLGSKGEI